MGTLHQTSIYTHTELRYLDIKTFVHDLSVRLLCIALVEHQLNTFPEQMNPLPICNDVKCMVLDLLFSVLFVINHSLSLCLYLLVIVLFILL